MGSFLVVVVIVVFVFMQARASKKRSSKKYESVERREMKQARSGAQTRQTYHEPAKPNRPDTVMAALNRPEPGETVAKPNVPRKERAGLRQKFEEYKRAKKTSAASATTVFEDIKKEDILTSAVENTVEVAQDNDRDEQIWAVNLDHVYDLMVKGPADTLSFQRDFVAEGMDMLNRFTTLPDSGSLSKYL